MRKLIFALLIVCYGIFGSIIMLPLSILNGLFGMFLHYWIQLIAGIKEYCLEVDIARAAKDKPFSWKEWANNQPEEPK
jgi:hypothetical protein